MSGRRMTASSLQPSTTIRAAPLGKELWKLILSSRCIGERPMDTYDKRSICDEVHVSINVLGGGGRHEIRQRSWGV